MISASDLTFVVQGNKRFDIFACIEKIRFFFPESKIIFSTWAGTDVSGLDCDEVVFSIDPGDSGDVFLPNNKGLSHLNNLNRQIVSSYNGLKQVKTKYAIKFRPDFILKSNKIWQLYNTFNDFNLDSENAWRLFNHRILMFCPASAKNTRMAYHICDYIQVGHTEDLLDLWNIPLISKEEAQYCIIHNVKDENINRAYRFACEQQIWLKNLEKKNIKYKKIHIYNDSSQEIEEDSIRSFVNNLYCIDYNCADISSPFNWLSSKKQNWSYTFNDYYIWYKRFIGENEKLSNFYKNGFNKIESGTISKYIKSDEVSVIVQGPINQKKIHACIASVRKFLPNSEIIISTWSNSDFFGVDCDKLLINKDPGNFNLTKDGIKNNVNRQIVSTKEALKIASRKYCLKLRSDSLLIGNKFLRYYCRFTKYEKDFHCLCHRILTLSYFSRDPNFCKHGIYKNSFIKYRYPFHPSDMVMFGSKIDMLDYWDIPIEQQKNTLDINCGIYGKVVPEQYIFLSFLEKKGRRVEISNFYDNSQNNISLTEHFFASNFIFLSKNDFGVKFQDSRFSIFLNPKLFLSCYTRYKWERLYKKYCDKNYFTKLIDVDIFYIKLSLFFRQFLSLFKN